MIEVFFSVCHDWGVIFYLSLFIFEISPHVEFEDFVLFFCELSVFFTLFSPYILVGIVWLLLCF